MRILFYGPMVVVAIGCAQGIQGGEALSRPSLEEQQPEPIVEEPTPEVVETDNNSSAAELTRLSFADICTSSAEGLQCVPGRYQSSSASGEYLVLVNPNASYCLNPASAFVDLGEVLGAVDEVETLGQLNNLGECNPPQ